LAGAPATSVVWGDWEAASKSAQQARRASGKGRSVRGWSFDSSGMGSPIHRARLCAALLA
jgi:hypothetical protein